MKNRVLLSLIFILAAFESADCQENYVAADSVLFARAEALSQKFITIDTHIDLPGWLYDQWFDVSQLSGQGEFDYPRATKGGLDVAFMSIYTAPELENKGRSKVTADSNITLVHKIIKDWPDKFSFAGSTSEVMEQLGKGKVILTMGMENGSPLENNLANLQEFYNKGIRYITLAHYKWNHISDSANDPERKWNGLSPFGEQVIKEMNRLGIMVDVSHISDSAFYDVIRLSKAPVIASHSDCRFFTPGNERNMSDEMIKVLAENGGVLQINFASFFLVNEIFMEMEKNEAEVKEYLKMNNIDPRSQAGREYSRKFNNEHKLGRASVKNVADHIDHVKNLVGIEYVGLGSDFNGVGDHLPVGLEDVSKIPNLVYELLIRGYTDSEIEKILGGNLLRVWKRVEIVSERLNSVSN